MRRLLPYIAVLLSMLIWSASGIAVKEALVALSPMTMIVIRFTLAVLLMLVVGLCARKSEMFRLQKVDKKDLPLFILGGIFQPFLYYILETFSYDALSSPTIAEALLSTSPVLAPFFAAAILREHVTRYNILGIIVSTVGMLLLVLVGASDFSIGNPWGIACAFAAVSAAVLYTIVLRRIPPGYNPLTVVFYVQLSSVSAIRSVLSALPAPMRSITSAPLLRLYGCSFSSANNFRGLNGSVSSSSSSVSSSAKSNLPKVSPKINA